VKLNISFHPELNEENADRIIIRLAIMLAHLRTIVPTWETYGTQGSEYGYAMPKIEDPTRAMTQLRNFARSHALSQGRLHFSMEDIPFIIQIVMSTASTERVRIFELLLANNGVLRISQICEYLDISKPTALRTMTELKIARLVDMIVPGRTNTEVQESQIRLKNRFNWFNTKEFEELYDKSKSTSTTITTKSTTSRITSRIIQ
jgi:DNA-binding transcriptional ArsR family regulator